MTFEPHDFVWLKVAFWCSDTTVNFLETYAVCPGLG